jgi:NAD(P)-dependent dehydrogenase (short-subunit alcohol dehydrogenase family)
MSNKLAGKVPVITGGNSGIGLATAKRFVPEGAYVFITGRRQGELQAAVKEIAPGVASFQGDVSNLSDLDRLHAAVKERKGRIDGLFANAGLAESAPLGEISEAHFDKTCGVNVKGFLFTVQKALPLFSSGGSIIRVNAISPGPIDIPGLSNLGQSEAEVTQMKTSVVAAIPLGRLGHPDEVARVATFLASDDSSFVTGIELFVDGGMAQI